MEVILQERIRNLGDLGEKVSVKAGYARNYLIPQRKAVVANAENLAAFEAKRAEFEAIAAETLKTAQTRAEKLNGFTVTMAVQCSEEGKLFGSIGTVEIEHAIQKAGLEVTKSEIQLPEGPFHYVGEYEVTLQLHTDVVTNIQLHIVSA